MTLFIKSADFACCAIPATTNKLLLPFITNSSTFCIFLILGISPSIIKTHGSSNTAVFLSLSVIKCGDIKPESNCTPSTMSTYVSSVSDSSIRTTPFLPTFS